MQSHSTLIASHGSWPYSHPGLPNSSTMVRNSLGQYSSYPGNNTLTTTSYPTPIHSLHSLSNTAYPYGPTRQSYPTAYNHGFPDDIYQTYDLQPSSNYHPAAQEAHLPALDYLSPEISRQWTPVSMNSRQSQQTLSMDQDTSGRMTQVQYSQPSTVSASIPFPTLGVLGASLPPFVSRGRTLPMPDSQRSSVGHSTNSISSNSGENTTPQTLSHRHSVAWTSEKIANDETSTSSASSTISGNGSGGNSSSPQVTQKPTAMSFQTIATNPSSRDVYYGASNATTSLASAESRLDPENTTFHRRLSKAPDVSSQQQSSSHYGYSLGSSTRNGTSDQGVANGTLMSGQLYNPLEEPQQSYENPPALSSETSHAGYRTSVSSLTDDRLY